MAKATNIFRIFVSSTFSDLTEERNVLQEKCFPRLRELCMEHGCRFQAIDLRWGISGEASLDQRTMRICLEELKRCQDVTPRPNFVVLLGERYGWRPLPEEIEADEFEMVLEQVQGKEGGDLLGEWYEKDENNLPSIYYLKPRSGEYADWETWREVEDRIRSILLEAATRLDLDEDKRSKYVSSATEQEIDKGALNVRDAHEHVFAFFRTIEGLPEDESAKDYRDLDEEGNPLPGIPQKLTDLKERLEEGITEDNIHEYKARWMGYDPEDRDKPPITTDHLEKLSDDVCEELSKVILKQIEELERRDALESEIDQQELFGEERSSFFTGRTSMLDRIEGYLEGGDNHPLALFGKGGTGKSALSAFAAFKARKDNPGSHVVLRFIGATPGSSDGLTLLDMICREIMRAYGGDTKRIPAEWKDLVPFFKGLLTEASEGKPLILFIDSLDQLAGAYNARNLTWIPPELPGNVKMVLTTRPTGELDILRRKLPEGNLMELGPMSLKEGNALLSLWLKDAGRKLQGFQRKELLGEFVKAEGNPLYLRMAFGEAGLWSSGARDKDLSTTVKGIIRDLFGRLSREENHGKVLTSRVLSYLAASRYGLSEDEIMDVLSGDSEVMDDFKKRSPASPHVEKLPVAAWSRFYYDMEPYLTRKVSEGVTLLAFYHRELGEVAVEDYLGDVNEKRFNASLAEYFHKQADPDGNLTWQGVARALTELPYHEAMGEMWDKLHDTLVDFNFLENKALRSNVRDFNVPEEEPIISYGGPISLQQDYEFALDRFPEE